MMQKFLLPLGFCFFASGLLGGCLGSKGPSLEEQVHQQDMQLKQLQPAQAETINQLEAMRQEINDLKGQIDDLKNVGGAQAVVSRIKKHDEALRQIETNMAMNLDLGNPIKQSGYEAAAAKANQAAQSPGSYGQPKVAGEFPEGVEPWGGNEKKAAAPAAVASAAPSAATWGQATPKPEETKAPQKDLSLALYDAGLNAYNSRNYSEAQRSFSDFLKNFSDHKLVPDAQYYLAECYFQKNQFSDAALAYNEVITRYSKSSHVAGAYLKQGICFSKSGQKEAALARMKELIKKFPKSPEAARAKNFLKTNA